MAVLKRTLGAAAALFAISAGPAAAEEWKPETFTLSNGMDVIVLPDHRAPVVTHMLWYKVGAVDEAPGKSGMAHLFEHVMSHATDDLAHREIDSIVQRNGGQKNAFTSWDYTAYFERVAKDQLGLMMSLEAERMTDLIIDNAADKGFVAERDVVKEERRQRIENSPSALLQEEVLSAFWRGHPYEITVIGDMDEVSALRPEDGRLFYDTYYSPDNVILVLAGDITAEEVRPLAEEHYGAIAPKQGGERIRRWQPVDPLTETQLITRSDPKVKQPVWYRYYMGTSTVRDQAFADALNVGLDVLGQGRTSLLYQKLVEERKLAINVGTGAWTSLHDEGPAMIYATPAEGVSVDELEAAVMEELYAALEAGFTEEDVVRARNSIAASAIYARDSQYGMAQAFGSHLAKGGDVDDLLTFPDRIRAVTPDAALDAVRRVFAEDKHYIEAHLLPAEGDS
nr:pitrilysin family protein [uncultured Hyphomonas sp.]